MSADLKKFRRRLSRIISIADIVVEVIDARLPELSRCKAIEQKVVRKGKKLIIVLNKADLVPLNFVKNVAKEISKEFPVVFVSAKKRYGTRKLREAIGKISEGKEVKVALIGLPNVGKSSLINALKGRRSAKVASYAGFTKGEQFIRISKKLLLIDSPGIVETNDEFLLALVAAINVDELKDAEAVAIKILKFAEKRFPKFLEKLRIEKISNNVLEEIAFRIGRISKGEPLTEEAAKFVVQQWQKNFKLE